MKEKNNFIKLTLSFLRKLNLKIGNNAMLKVKIKKE